ncbi:uncharacterized protein APUU_40074A [Aspergillus puulaauensis]|uniref:Cytochrome P450 n=1 Tax=Aspergillus puulaauensis TaxID=1220207 RepID=A0A7R7XLC4_9EURO|nr:uncharacterized protein APUU_40074A [Aspergillus puulaauensis]BCS23630.1 hypothetical protein APUU_40074A [Aspergillus puulaauensis]
MIFAQLPTPAAHALHFIQSCLLLCITALVVLFIVHTFLYAFLLSPVRHVPGPWWARVSRIPLLYATWQRRRSRYASDLLQKYGRLVVIAPDQIHTTDETAMKTIYAKSSTKTRFYASMGSWKGVTSTLGFVDYRSAASTRNNLIQCFQNRNLDTLVESMACHITEFCDMLRPKVSNNNAVDGVVIFRLLALDIVTDILWGEKDTLLSKGFDQTPVFLRRFHAFSSWNALKSFIPGLDAYTRFLGSSTTRQLRADCNDMDVTAREALERWHARPEERHQKDVLSMLQAMSHSDDPTKRIPSEHIPAYMVEMLAAGSSTTSHTAAFACDQLARYPRALEALQRELIDTFPDKDNIDERQMLSLQYLEGVIYETMRLYPMIPGPLERHLGEWIEVDGMKVSPGVIASTAAYDQGRLPDVFPEPEKWRPERWLQATDRMKFNWIPFGHGCRSCPGSNLALTELKYILGTLFRRFRVQLPEGYPSEPLDLADVFAAGSKTGHCWLQFEEMRT